MSAQADTAWTTVGIVVVSTGFALFGGAAYVGAWRSWARRGTWSSDRVFPTLFLGLGGLCLGAFVALLGTRMFVLTAIAVLLSFVLILTAVALFVFGVPRWITPPWYRRLRGED